MPRKTAQEMLESLSELAAELFGDDEKGASNYVGQHMEKLGYKRRVTWDDADDGNDGDTGFNPFGNGGRREREVRRGGERRASGGGFGTSQYS